ncbi:MAG TPA: hypothetical protein VNN20_15120 [Thermodesulfobacteriota bacterium]|nr:hypothetical protein [Thermodesulfobacteriota bacterium]
MTEIPSNIYLAILVLILGLAMVSWSLSWGVKKVLQESLDPMRALALVRSMRIGLVGLSLVGIGAGWIWNMESLLFLSIIFGCEELYETSLVIALLKRSPLDSSKQAQA